RVKAGLQYIAINLASSMLFLIGVGLMYSVTGTLNMADLAARAATLGADDLALYKAGMAILLVAFLTKAGMWPLSFCLPTPFAASGRHLRRHDQGGRVRDAADADAGVRRPCRSHWHRRHAHAVAALRRHRHHRLRLRGSPVVARAAPHRGLLHAHLVRHAAGSLRYRRRTRDRRVPVLPRGLDLGGGRSVPAG